jgi:hypothetical protein
MWSHSYEDGLGNAVIAYDADNSVTFSGIDLATLQSHSDDFFFV